MIEEEAFVADVADGIVWIETASGSACAGCSQSCPGSLAGGFFGQRRVRLKISSNLPLQPGDRVLVGISEDALALGATRIYLFPLIGLFVGALLGKFIDDSDLFSALGGLTGMSLCFLALKTFRQFEKDGYRPLILRKID